MIACQIPRAHRHRAPLGTSDAPEPPIETKSVCRSWPERWGEHRAEVQPSDVLLVLGAPAVEDEYVGGRWLTACDQDWRDFYGSEVLEALNLLASLGSSVWVASVSPPPTPEIFPREWIGVVACLNDVLREAIVASPAHDRLIDLGHFICPRGECRTKIDGKVIREDFVHFDGEGGALVARWLVDRMTTTPRVG